MTCNVTDGNHTCDFSQADTTKVVIDGLGQILVMIVGFASLVGLVLLYRWFKKK